MTRSKPLITLKFTILLLILPFAVQAQNEVWRYYEASDTLIVEAERETQLPSYSTMISKIPIRLQDTPASVGIVLKSQFDSQNAMILSDAMRNISGANIQSNFGVHDYFYIRGFNSLDNGMILTDGTIETESTFYNLYNIERIEVLKGPGAFLYGGNPLSGTVNLARKQPIYRSFLDASGSVGAFNTFRGTVDLGLADIQSGVAFRLNGFWHESDNFRDEKQSKQFAINPAFTWRITPRTDITVNFEYAQNDFKPDSGLPIRFSFDGSAPVLAEVPRERSYQTPFDDSDQTIYRTRFDFSSKINETITIRNKSYFADQDWQTTGTLLFGATPSLPQGQIVVNRAVQNLNDRQKYLGNQFDLLSTFETGSVKHNFVTGFEVTRYDDDFRLRFAGIAPIDLMQPVESTTDSNLLFYLQTTSVDAKTTTFAPYFADQIALNDRLKVFVGGRYDVITYDDTRTAEDLISSLAFTTDTERNYKKFSPMAGALVSASENVSLYFNGGKAFAPPSTLTNGSPESEESTQFELGSKIRFLQGKANIDIAVYHLNKDNIEIPDSTGVFTQLGKQRSNGIELDLQSQPFDGVFTSLSYAYTDAELTDFSEMVQTQFGDIRMDRSGNIPAFAPEHILNFWTTKKLQNGFGIGLGTRYVSKQYIAADNMYKIDGYFLLNAALFYQKPTWRWNLNFNNITNTDYEMRGFMGSSVIPANPFSVLSTVEIRL